MTLVDRAGRAVALGRPITPVEVGDKKAAQIPPEVFDAFNELIAKDWDGREATVKQVDVADLIRSRKPELAERLYEDHLLDVEGAYRKAGWTVEYEKPCYYGGDNFEPYFRFRKGRRK